MQELFWGKACTYSQNIGEFPQVKKFILLNDFSQGNFRKSLIFKAGKFWLTVGKIAENRVVLGFSACQEGFVHKVIHR